MVKITYDTQKASIKLSSMASFYEGKTQKLIDELGSMGVNMAKRMAPEFSGRTRRLIKSYPVRQGDIYTRYIQSPNPTLSDGHRRNIQNFNLVRWMHTSPRAREHIRTGLNDYMVFTLDYLEGKADNVARGIFKK